MRRDVEHALPVVDEIQNTARGAILAGTTGELVPLAGAAQQQLNDLIYRLQRVVDGQAGDDDGVADTGRVDGALVQAALASLNLAWTFAEKVGLGTTVDEMRRVLVDFLIHTAYAGAYLRASINAVVG